MLKVLLIGSTGFVGRHLAEELGTRVKLFVTSRQLQSPNGQVIYFDFSDQESWANIKQIAPDIVINSAGYGVVKEQTDLEAMYDINYRLPQRLINYLTGQKLAPFWLQIGTAFEYDLTNEQLAEESACVPLTHYGISKYLLSNFLLSASNKLPFLILRPFAMFGPYESASKLIPYLITAQHKKERITLSSGKQERDYFYVKDLSRFVSVLLERGLEHVKDKVINIGSGVPNSLLEIAKALSKCIPDFQPSLWQWNSIPQRDNENTVFYNSSSKAQELDFHLTPSEEAFRQTIAYYWK